MDQQQQEQPPALYAIVELFGHQRVAGRVSQQTFGGSSFVRVDVPEIEVEEHVYRGFGADDDGDAAGVKKRVVQAHTRSFGGGAIYAINWCDEATAAIAARAIKHEPLSPYSVKSAIDALPDDQRQRLLASTPSRQRSLVDDDDGDDRPY
jgi:hypothetical protein